MRHTTLMLACLLLGLASCGGTDDSAPTTPAGGSDAFADTGAATTTTMVVVTTSAAREATTTSAASDAMATTSTTTTSTTTAPPEDPQLVIEVVIDADGSVEVLSLPEVARGDEVTVVVTSEIADEVHVHGYDVYADLSPGIRTEFTFIADIPGIFEVELEGSHDLLFELQVR